MSTRTLALLAPDGGEVLKNRATISWTANAALWNPAHPLSLSYSPDAGGEWHAIDGAAGILGTAQAFDWDVRGLADGNQYMVTIV